MGRGGFGGGHGYSLGFMNGVFFYHCLVHHSYPVSLIDCDFSSKKEMPTETLSPDQAKEKLQEVIEENLVPKITGNADQELEKVSKEGVELLKGIGIASPRDKLNDDQLEKAYQHAAYLTNKGDIDSAFKVLVVLHRQFPDHSELTKELAQIAVRCKNPPNHLAAHLQIQVMKTQKDPLYVKNLVDCLKN
ncbi:MAG: hypothetical protein HWD61_03170 [Parachlamydiaceae bacterium]|nr:MAG: hypothetical protein HWD61_03170 [Parachlamydiaceae bacterium]